MAPVVVGLLATILVPADVGRDLEREGELVDVSPVFDLGPLGAVQSHEYHMTNIVRP